MDGLSVQRRGAGERLVGGWSGVELANAFLAHLQGRAFSPATVRAYAFDLLNFGRYCTGERLDVATVTASDVFGWVDWQQVRRRPAERVMSLRGFGSAPATINRRIAAVRGLFEFAVMTGIRAENPVPAARRSSGLRAVQRGVLGHLGPGRRRAGGRLVREQRRLPESLAPSDVEEFLTSLGTHRDRAMVLAMLLGGLRSAEVRGRPARLSTAECFVVLRGPTVGAPISEAGLRSVFRRHRELSGAARVRPHRLRHTYGTELAAAGIDLLALRELMGHVSPETTAGYVHLSVEQLAAEYAAARATTLGIRR
jgi:integrase/recombinase XerC